MMQTSSPTQHQPAAGLDEFLAALHAAELFAPMQQARAEAIATQASTAEEASAALIEAGFLTRFQADRLLAGKTDGFHLGPYVILEQIGRGSIGRVFRARHRTMNRPVAVKVVAAELTRTAAARQEFQKAIRAAAQLNHPNIVAAYDANEVADRFYMVHEYIDGPSFATVVAERGPLPVSEACTLVRQAANGLAHAHERGMVHRDIKPTNLLVSRSSKSVPDPLVKIADFGIASLSPSPSADCIAPECARNPEGADHRADLYSLGAVLYFLLAGRFPFPNGTRETKLQQHALVEPLPVESLRPDLPPVLAALVHQMLAKDPNDRPESAVEVAARLDAIAGGDPLRLDLPSVPPAPYPVIAGPLSNTCPMPPARVLPATSFSELFALSTPTPSPWEELTRDDDPRGEAATIEWISNSGTTSGEPRGLASWSIALLASGMMVLCLLAVGIVVKTMGK